MRTMHPPINSMARTPGLRTVQQGWKNNSIHRRSSTSEKAARRDAQIRAFDALPPEEQAKRMQAQRDYQADMDIWRKEFDDPAIGPEEASKRLKHRRDQRRILEGFVDQDARVAVEGDTDLNHDNLEGGE